MANSIDTPALPDGWGPVLEVRAPGICNLLLTDCRFEWVAGRLFLVGLSHDSERDLAVPPLRQAIPWDAVDGVISFGSVAERREWWQAQQARDEAYTRGEDIPF